MATKANLLTAINTQLTAIITQTKVRLASSLIVDNLYSNQIIEFSEAQSLTTRTNDDFTYKLIFNKVGNMVFLNGRIRNDFGDLYSGGVLNISNLEYRPNEIFYSSNGIIVNSDGVLSIPTLGNLDVINFSITYQTNG
jgi:hypothetical protein